MNNGYQHRWHLWLELDTLQHIVSAEQSYFSRISTGQIYRRPKDAPPLTIAEMTE